MTTRTARAPRTERVEAAAPMQRTLPLRRSELRRIHAPTPEHLARQLLRRQTPREPR